MHFFCCAPELIIFTFPPATPPLVHSDGNKHWTCQAGHTTFKWPQCLCNGLMNKLSEHLTSHCLLACLIFEGNARRMPVNFSRVLLSAAASQSPINSPEQLSIGQMPISSFSISISCCWMLPHVPANYLLGFWGAQETGWLTVYRVPSLVVGKKVPLKWGMTACQCQPPRLLPTSIIYPKAFKHVNRYLQWMWRFKNKYVPLYNLYFQIVMWRENWFGPDVRWCKTALSFRKICSTVHEGTSPCVTGWHSQWSRFAWSRELRGEVKVHAFSAFRHVQHVQRPPVASTATPTPGSERWDLLVSFGGSWWMSWWMTVAEIYQSLRAINNYHITCTSHWSMTAVIFHYGPTMCQHASGKLSSFFRHVQDSICPFNAVSKVVLLQAPLTAARQRTSLSANASNMFPVRLSLLFVVAAALV